MFCRSKGPDTKFKTFLGTLHELDNVYHSAVVPIREATWIFTGIIDLFYWCPEVPLSWRNFWGWFCRYLHRHNVCDIPYWCFLPPMTSYKKVICCSPQRLKSCALSSAIAQPMHIFRLLYRRSFVIFCFYLAHLGPFPELYHLRVVFHPLGMKCNFWRNGGITY